MKVRRTVSYGGFNNITVEIDSEDAGYLPGAMTCDETFKVLTELVDRNIRKAIRKHELEQEVQTLEGRYHYPEPKLYDSGLEDETIFAERHKAWEEAEAKIAKELSEAKAQLAKWSEDE
jgi:hypothetical protein